MKVLLDENLPHNLRQMLNGHDVYTVAYMGWAAVANGALLRAAAGAGFDVFLTMDAGVEYQQYAAALPLAVVVMRAKSNRLDEIRPLLPAVLATFETLVPCSLVSIPEQ